MFKPHWTAETPLGTFAGTGLLNSVVSRHRSSIVRFKVFCPGYSITLYPFTGQIFADTTLSALVPSPAALVWFRTASISLHNFDIARSRPTLHHYWVGLFSGGFRTGYSLSPSGCAFWQPSIKCQLP